MSTLQPRHYNGQVVGTGSVHSTFVNFVISEDTQGFGETTAPLVGTGSVHNAFNLSTYQMWPSYSTQAVLSFGKDQGLDQDLDDDIQLFMSLSLVEDQPLDDWVECGRMQPANDDQDLDDSAEYLVTVSIIEDVLPDDIFLCTTTLFVDENQDLDDLVVSGSVAFLGEDQDLDDQLLLTASIFVTENNRLDDSLTTSEQVNFTEDLLLGDTWKLKIHAQSENSAQIQIMQYLYGEYSAQVQLFRNNPPPSNILISPINPYQPIVVIDGTTYAGSPPAGAINLIKIDRGAGLGCDVIDFSVNLGFSGGTFEVRFMPKVEPPPPYPGINAEVTVAGFAGVVTEAGWVNNPSQGNAWMMRGIFGSRNLNRGLLFYANSCPGVAAMSMNTLMKSPPIKAWSTISSCALELARAAGINLAWQAKDGPIADMFPESGMSVGSAIQSLAGRVGGMMIWAGRKDSFVVGYPDGMMGGGGGSFPDCKLISTIESFDILDEIRDYACVGVTGLYTSSAAYMPSALSPPDKLPVVKLYTTQSKPGPDDQFMPIDLNPDYDGDAQINGKIQIWVKPGKEGDPYTTVDNSIWFDAGLSIMTDPFTGVKKLILDSLPFPPSLNDKEFTLSVGYTRKVSAFRQNVREAHERALEAQKILLGIQQSKTHYIRTHGFQVSGQFYGAVPIPGGMFSAQKGKASASGVIESVSIQGGQNTLTTIQIGGAHYKCIEFVSASQYIDWMYATGGGSQPTP